MILTNCSMKKYLRAFKKMPVIVKSVKFTFRFPVCISVYTYDSIDEALTKEDMGDLLTYKVSYSTDSQILSFYADVRGVI